MKSNYKLFILVFILIVLLFSGCNRDNYGEIQIKLDNDNVKIKGADTAVFEDGTVYITEGGTYTISGIGEEIQILVDCNEIVTLILDEVQIINKTKSAIKIESNFVVNIKSIGEKPNVIQLTGEDSKQCIKAEGDLFISGDTEMYLEGINGINAKDLYINNGFVSLYQLDTAIKAKDIIISNSIIDIKENRSDAFGIYAKDSAHFTKSDITIITKNDCIHSEDEVTIDGGQLNLQTEDDAIHSKNNVTIQAGEIDITKCLEGIESKSIDIYDGKIKITSDNDGINAVRENENKKSTIIINGGEITINADGDGLDANGDIIINGGVLFVSGANGGDNNAIDFDNEFIINGGILIATGNANDAKQPSDKSMQNAVMIEYDDVQSADEGLALVDNDGNVIIAADIFKPYDCLIISLPELKMNSEYYIGETTALKDNYIYPAMDKQIEYNKKNNTHFIIIKKIFLIKK